MKTFVKSFIKKKLLGKASAKAQSAMEYLMTYGWAILIISVVLAALFQLGVFNPMTFAPKAPPGSCQVFRPNGPYTTSFINLEGICSGELPQYVGRFNGVNAYVNTAQTGSLAFTTQPFTVILWIYPFLQKVTYPALLYEGVWSSNGWGVGYESYKIVFYDLGRGQKYYSANVYPPGKWYFVAIIRNGLNGSILVNGVLDSNFSLLGNLIASTQPLSIGATVTSSSITNFYAGIIANVQIYNTSLSANEIQALYLEGIGGAPIDLQNLVGWWPLNGNANDYSGNDNNGQAYNVSFVGNWWSGYTPP